MMKKMPGGMGGRPGMPPGGLPPAPPPGADQK